MNLPNKLTILRMIMIPVFLVVLYIPGLGMSGNIAAAAIFILASITDFLDGKIARKYNLVTNFGKFMDPLADKLLVCSALIALVDFDKVAAWIVIIIIAREFIISGFRLIAADNGVVIAASYWGKFKTTFQMIMIILLILDLNYPFSGVVNMVVTYIALILTVVLPDDSGPYISTTLPLGTPPKPSAISRLNEPVGIHSTFILVAESPSFITEPLPNCFSILEIAASSAFILSSLLTNYKYLHINEHSFVFNDNIIYCVICQ